MARDLGPFLEAVARRRRGRALDDEDATQEAWLILLARVPRFRPCDDPDGFLRWLGVVVRNRLANLERRAAARPEVPIDRAGVDAMPGRDEDPAEALDRRRLREQVDAALEDAFGRIPEVNLRILRLRWIESRTVPEIAEALGLTPAQVRDRHRRAFPALRVLVERRVGRPASASDPAPPDSREVMP